MKLKEIRIENNLSQEDIASILKVSRSTYSLWELNIDLIPIKRLLLFSDYFNISIDYILELSNIKKYPNNKKYDITLSSKRIKNLRINNNYTQDKLASILKIDRSLLSKYESGANPISTTFLIAYAKTFNISCDYLLGKIDEKTPEYITL